MGRRKASGKRGWYRKDHLDKHVGGWRWRFGIPADLRGAFGGKRELAKYLGQDETQARISAAVLTRDWTQLRDRLRALPATEREGTAVLDFVARLAYRVGPVTFSHTEATAPPEGGVGLPLDHAAVQQMHARLFEEVGAIEPDPGVPFEAQARHALAASYVRQHAAALRSEADSTIKLASKLGVPKPERFIDPLIDAWLRVTNPKDKESVNDKRRSARRFLDFLNRAVEPRDVARKDALAWRDHLEANSGFSSPVQKKRIDDLARLYKCAVSEGIVENNPFVAISVRKVENRKFIDDEDSEKSFTRAQVKALLSVIDGPKIAPNFAWMLRLMVFHGMRGAEVCQLRTDDVAKVEGVLCLKIHDRYGSLKNAASLRDVPLHPKCKGIVAYAKAKRTAAGGKGGYLFDLPSWNKRRGKFRKVARKILAMAGIPADKSDPLYATIHDLRHTFITCSREVSMPEAVSSAVTGHSRGANTHAQYGTDVSLAKRARWIVKIDPAKQAPLA